MADETDYALLVGINAYPLTTYAPLQGPPNDLALVQDWLIHDAGVPEANVRIQRSPQPEPPASPEYPPTTNHIWAELRSIVLKDGKLQYRPNNRLYLYFSGHGFSSAQQEERHAALFVGNVAPYASMNVCGTTMARWCQNAGVFGEIVLVMDCCRDREVTKPAGEPQIDPVSNPTRAKDVRRFEIYAVPYGEKAQERLIPQLGKVHGLLTYAWIEAMKHAPAQNGKRTEQDIKQFIEGAWGTIVGEERVEQPDFVTMGRGNFNFTAAASALATGRIRFQPALAAPAQVLIADASNQPMMRIELSPAQQTRFNLVSGGAGVASAFDGLTLEVELPLAIYKVTLQRAGVPDASQLWTLLGGADVDFQV